ncbi:MAG: hypothetical protein ACRDG8_01915 [Actinomycetota bacterium]
MEDDLKPALEAALQEARTKLTRAEGRRQALADEISNLQEEVRGLELALARRKGGSSTGSPASNGWGKLSRTGAVERLLRETGKPMGPSEISRALNERGRPNDNAHYVSAALSYLKTRKVVVSAGNGRWRPRETEPKANLPMDRPTPLGLREMDQIVAADAEKRAASG